MTLWNNWLERCYGSILIYTPDYFPWVVEWLKWLRLFYHQSLHYDSEVVDNHMRKLALVSEAQ